MFEKIMPLIKPYALIRIKAANEPNHTLWKIRNY